MPAAILAGVLLTTGSGDVLAQSLPKNACDVEVQVTGEPIPEGVERGAKIICENVGKVEFNQTLKGNVLRLLLSNTPINKVKAEDKNRPLQCTVEGPAFQ